MTVWRLLQLATDNAFANMAIDEAITTARIKGLAPDTLRFYRWNPSAVSIGRFQNVFNEVQVENCRRQNVDVVRRITGGGTVYHDFEGEITYSIVAKEETLGTQDVVIAYNMISKGLIEAAKILGVNASLNPGNSRNCPNIAIGGKKVSGSAQFHKGGVLLQHGTFLLDVDLAKMFAFLRVPWGKTINDVVCVAQERITSIRHETSSNFSLEKGYQALIRGFQKTFNMQFREEETLTSFEIELAEKLRREKYLKEEWNLEGKSKRQD